MSNNNTTEVTFPYPPVGPVGQWWIQMVVIAIVNPFFFAFTWYKTRKNLWLPPHPKHKWSYQYSYWMRILPIPFLIQTTWRAFLPSLYNSRTTIIDDPINSPIIARTGAFFGEILWGYMVAWALRVITLNVPMRGSPETQRRLRKYIPWVSYYIALAALVANVMSVVGLITTNYVFPTIEETLWASIFLFGAICSLLLWHFATDSWSFDWGSNCFGYDINPFDDPNKEEPSDPASVWVMRMYIRGYAIFGIAATPYMVIVDVPKWYHRYQADELNGVQYLGFADGIRDAATRRHPTQAYSDWDQDMLWMSGYFSFAMWAAIFLMYAPGRVTTCTCSEGTRASMPVRGEENAKPSRELAATGGPIVQNVV